MKTKMKTKISSFIFAAVIMMTAVLTAAPVNAGSIGLPEDSGEAAYPFVYDYLTETIKVIGRTSLADYFYTVKYKPAKADPSEKGIKPENYLTKLKWYPVYGTAVDVSKSIPMLPQFAGKEVYIGIIGASELENGVSFNEIMKIELPARAKAPKAKRDFEVRYTLEDTVTITKLASANIGDGLQYRIGLGTWMDVTLPMIIPMKNIPAGGIMEIRVKAGAYTFPARENSSAVTVNQAAASESAKIKLSVPAKKPKIKIAPAKDSGLSGIKSGQEYRLWNGYGWDSWKMLVNASGMLDILQSTVPQADGLKLVEVRTAATADGKRPASLPVILDVTIAPAATADANLIGK
jgi:hypothetical protein